MTLNPAVLKAANYTSIKGTSIWCHPYWQRIRCWRQE